MADGGAVAGDGLCVEVGIDSPLPVGVGASVTRAMRRAIELAGDPTVRPGANPRVGCVLLDDRGEPIAEGHHRGAGTLHAEADALSRVPPGRHPHTAVVTLEPCNHTGRTEPCTEALLHAGVRRVVYALSDPNPVAAGGAQRLRAAGLDVHAGLLAEQAARVDPHWFAATRLGRPHVTWKIAATIDGRVAARDGSSRWITSAAARADGHRERAAADAVLAGTGTVLVDDSQLSVRDDAGPLPRHRQPTRVVVGTRPLPAAARVLDDSAPTMRVPSHDPADALATVWAAGGRRVLLEGGPTLGAAFLRAGYVDRVVCYLAPALLGAGAAAVADLGINRIDDIVRFDVDGLDRLGPDIRIVLINPNARLFPAGQTHPGDQRAGTTLEV